MLRASPCTSNPALIQFDDLQRTAIGKIANCIPNDVNWIQASLPVEHGELGSSIPYTVIGALFKLLSYYL